MTRRAFPVAALVNRFMSGVRFPWLFTILAGLLVIDLVIPDPVPFIDEVILTMLTVLAASWRSGRTDERQPPKDITPVDQAEGLLSDGGAESGVHDGDHHSR